MARLPKAIRSVKKYWRKYVKDHNGIELDLSETPKNRKIKQIYTRTILLYSLLINSETGGMRDIDVSYLGNNKWQLFDEFDIYEFEMTV